MIFQDPFSSLNPRFTVHEIVTEGLVEHGLLEPGETSRDAAVRWLEEVGLKAEHADRYPHEFSGGQRQRICIARAIAVRPRFVVCDEAVSALDVTIQALVIELLIELRRKHGLSYLFISHDLSVVKKISDRVAVMRHGRIVEQGPTDRVIEHPEADYTRRLIDAVPVPGGARKRR
jgi:oligopeptide transport system ATP-binding protein